MLNKHIYKALEATAKAGGISPESIVRMLDALKGEEDRTRTEPRPILLTQAAKARQLGVSRFTVRKLTQAGKLHPVELLPGLLRYHANELIKES